MGDSAVVQFELGRGERLLWSGTPRQGIVFRASDLLFVPFSILWAGFAFSWEASAIRNGAPFFFLLWGVPFILIGAYIVAGRFWFEARKRRKTAYGLTTERVIISSVVLRPTLKSLSLETLSDITLDQKSDGSGTITFGPTHPLMALSAGSGWPGIPGTPAFEQIPDAKHVYDLIREAQRSARRPST